jgi:hypothetical protein
MQSTDDFMKMRGTKIARVAKSLGQIHKMYSNLNEIVEQQGITLHRIEDNTAES